MGKGNKPMKNDKASMKAKRVGSPVKKMSSGSLFGMDAPGTTTTGQGKKSYGR